MKHSQLYDRLRYLLSFRLGGFLKAAEEEEYLLTQLLTTMFVEQPVALPGFAKLYLSYIQKQVYYGRQVGFIFCKAL